MAINGVSIERGRIKPVVTMESSACKIRIEPLYLFFKEDNAFHFSLEDFMITNIKGVLNIN